VTAIALTVAGSDSSGGAGIQADLKTFSAMGVYGASVITALTAQNTLGVQAIHEVPPDFVREQMRSVFEDLGIGAVKIGMLSRPEIIEEVAAGLERFGARQVVLDPVMVAASGDVLIAPEAVEAIRRRLMGRVLLITPNLPEAARLLDTAVAGDETEMERQARALLELGPRAVLVKGGHAAGPESVDILATAEGVHRLSAPRVATQNTHGTGCTLSSAVAAGLAKGRPLEAAMADAKAYLTAAISRSDELEIGRGHGPVHHFHAWW